MITAVKSLGIVVLVATLAGAAWTWFRDESDGQGPAFVTARAERGDLLAAISATGTVVPEEVVDVGAQVAGQIQSFGTDRDGRPVDYGSEVDEGTVLARIDDSLYAADVAQAEAHLQSAEAGVRRAEADLDQLKAKREQARRDWERAQKLGPSEALAQSSYDAYRTGYASAAANVKVGEAAILQARAEAAEATASLARARRNLGYCTIKSPVKGVIIDRRVNIGQTVVSSLNAPSLFLIAKDLRRMQVWVPVNEVDIGNIHPGQPVTFTVDAFPGEVFEGQVGKIRLNAAMTQNVVTYTVEVITDNSSGKLLPYLTADVKFELGRRHDVVRVPNAALRWEPPAEAAAVRAATSSGSGAAGGRRGRNQGTVWVPRNNGVEPVAVTAGLSDGAMTEVEGPDLRAGMEVVVGVRSAESSEGGGDTTPFAPQFGRSRRSAAGG